MCGACGDDELHGADAARTLRGRIFGLPLSVFGLWSEPASPEQKAGAERCKKDRPALNARFLRSILQCSVKGRAAGGGAKISGSSRDGRKSFRRDAALLREQLHEARIWLVSGKPADGSAGNSATQLDRVNHFFHARDGCARKRFAVKLHIEAAYCPAQPKKNSPKR